MSHHILISLGSNCRQNAHIQWASQRLATFIDNPFFSKILWTHDNKGGSSMYMNRLVAGISDMTVEEIELKLKGFEQETGRSHDAVTIDLDLMLYDDVRYHLRDWPRPYIQLLLSDVL